MSRQAHERDRGEPRMDNETEVIREKMEATRTELPDKMETAGKAGR